MSKQAIVERILSDAEEEAKAIIADAEEKAAAVIAEAHAKAERNRIGTEAEIKEKCKGIKDGKAATARLDAAKVLLKEKRRVIDEVYAGALKQLIGLDKEDALTLAGRLLSAYAEEGDEIVFAQNYGYASSVAKLPIVAQKRLKVSPKTVDIDGGFILCGKNSDKDLSYGALLALDREKHQADIAAKIFVTENK